MKARTQFLNLALFFFTGILFSCCQSEAIKLKKPNIIYILADDLGYGELGCYGQTKIETPNIDQLAKEGIRFTQFYTGSPVCAPSRCILLTGRHSGNAYIRGNDELRARGEVWDYIAMANDPGLEGQYPMADTIVTLAEKLQSSGYLTALFGKWGLGYPGSESTPNSQGFDYFYGYNCQRQAHTLTPLHLWRNNEKVLFANDTIPPKTKLDPGVDPYERSSYDKYEQPDYAPSHIADDLISFVEDLDANEPFAVFWESPIPHVPLQAPRRLVDYYVEKFDDEAPYLGDKGYFPTRYPNATYAAMITYLDENIGRLIATLKEKGLYENTVIMFTSDNGPTYAGGVDASFFESAAPFRSDYQWGKGFLREGGIRVPLIVSWPERVKSGTVTDHISASQDVFPTICAIAGIDYTTTDIDGLTFLPELTEAPQVKHDYLYWEFPEYGGQQAVRLGDWKGYIDSIHHGNYRLQLYDLSLDPLETNDIANSYPEVVERMHQILVQEHTPSFSPRWQFELLDGPKLED